MTVNNLIAAIIFWIQAPFPRSSEHKAQTNTQREAYLNGISRTNDKMVMQNVSMRVYGVWVRAPARIPPKNLSLEEKELFICMNYYHSPYATKHHNNVSPFHCRLDSIDGRLIRRRHPPPSMPRREFKLRDMNIYTNERESADEKKT